MNENGLKSYANKMFGMAQKYQEILMRSKDVHITIDTTTCSEKLFATIFCHAIKDGKLTKTVRFEISEAGGFDSIFEEMENFVEFILPYLH